MLNVNYIIHLISGLIFLLKKAKHDVMQYLLLKNDIMHKSGTQSASWLT